MVGTDVGRRHLIVMLEGAGQGRGTPVTEAATSLELGVDLKIIFMMCIGRKFESRVSTTALRVRMSSVTNPCSAAVSTSWLGMSVRMREEMETRRALKIWRLLPA